MRYKKNDWYVFCDICGNRCLASTTTRLNNNTGRDGLIVCQDDIDLTDYGVVPYTPRAERPVAFTRLNHTDASNDYPVYDLETDNVGDLTFYTFLATSQGTNEFIMMSQENTLFKYAQEIDTASTVEEYGSYIYISTSQNLNELLIPSQYTDEDVIIALSQDK